MFREIMSVKLSADDSEEQNSMQCSLSNQRQNVRHSSVNKVKADCFLVIGSNTTRAAQPKTSVTVSVSSAQEKHTSQKHTQVN